MNFASQARLYPFLRILFLMAAVTWLAPSTIVNAQVPAITTGPANQALALGGTLTLSATASGGTPLAYQWFKDSRWLLGATNSTLTVSNAGVINSGMYVVVVTNASGMAISLPASVAVANPSLLDWGNNFFGQLGNGGTSGPYPEVGEGIALPGWFTNVPSTINPDRPNSVAGNVVAGAAGYTHSLFVTADLRLWGTGFNELGQLGNGTANDYYTMPVSVGSNVVAVAAGNSHSLFVTTDGRLWGTGWDSNGQLGNGTNGYGSPVPVCVASNVVAVAAGNIHSLFVTQDGRLWAMGDNEYGELGNGTTTEEDTPVNVASNVVMVAAGYGDSLFVTSDGTLWAMGFNRFDQLGVQNLDDSSVSTPIPVATGVMAVAAGGLNSLFVTTDGTLWAMGQSDWGESYPFEPPYYFYNYFPITTNVAAVAAGWNHALFVKNDGTLWAMGANESGELGNGTNGVSLSTPAIVPHILAANVFAADEAFHSLAMGILYTSNSLNLSGGTPHLTFVGTPGATHSVVRSTDLIHWSTIWTTNDPGNGVFQFTDPAPPQPNACYQLQSDQ